MNGKQSAEALPRRRRLFFLQNLDTFQELFQKGQTQQLGFGIFMLMHTTLTVTQVI
jgi:hypothetical protein